MKYYYICYTAGFAGNYLSALIQRHPSFLSNRPVMYGDESNTWILAGMFNLSDIAVPELEELKMFCQKRNPTTSKVLVRHRHVHGVNDLVDNLPKVVAVNKELTFVPIIVVASNLKAVVERSKKLAEIGKIPAIELNEIKKKQAKQLAAIEKFQLKTQHNVDYMYVDITKLIAGDVNDYLLLCEGIGETPDVPMFLDFMVDYARDVWQLRK